MVTHGSSGCYVRSEHRLVTCVGARDLVVVETADAVLLAMYAARHAAELLPVQLQPWSPKKPKKKRKRKAPKRNRMMDEYIIK